jgi:hypothetical protein
MASNIKVKMESADIVSLIERTVDQTIVEVGNVLDIYFAIILFNSNWKC